MQNIEELKNELGAPIKSIRIFAIESALKAENTPGLLACLQECLATEKDSECRILLEHAISKFSSDPDKKKTTALKFDDFANAFKDSDAKNQLALTNALKIVQLKNVDVESSIPQLLAQTKDPVVAAELVKKFRRYWPKSQLKYLETNVFSKTKSLQIACIETLIKNFPESLRSQLVKLIFINDPVVRSLAIRGMAKHFPEIAAEFIKECFAKGDYYNKVTALKICSTIDFSLIKDSLLLLMFKDPEMKIFELGCAIILANPDKEMPFRIISFIQKTSPQKAEIFKKLIGQYCKTIEIAGLCEDFPAYMKFLNDFPKMLAAKKFVNETLASYQEDDKDSCTAALGHLTAHLDNNYVLDALKKFIDNCTNKDLSNHLSALLKKENQPAAQDSEPPAEEKESKQQNSEKTLIRKLTRLKFSKSSEATELAKSILLAPKDHSESVVSAALKAAGHLKLTDFKSVAKTFLKSNNEKEIIAALEYLSLTDKEEFQAQIQKYINTDLQLVRINLIRITGQELPDYAVFLVKHMLEHKDAEIRKNGLEAAIHIDFFHLLPILIKLLEKEEETSLIDNALALIMANPLLESCYHLKCLEKTNSSYFTIFEKAGIELRSTLVNLGIVSKKEIDDYIRQKASNLKEKKEKVAREKELEQELSDIKSALNWNSISDSIEELKNLNWKRNLIIIISLFILFNIVHYFFMGNEKIEKELALKPVLSKVTSYDVKVMDVFPAANALMVESRIEPKETIILTPPKGSSFTVKKGDKLRIKGRPYKRNSKGHLFVEVSEVTIIND